jgi:hypothetical protein
MSAMSNASAAHHAVQALSQRADSTGVLHVNRDALRLRRLHRLRLNPMRNLVCKDQHRVHVLQLRDHIDLRPAEDPQTDTRPFRLIRIMPSKPVHPADQRNAHIAPPVIMIITFNDMAGKKPRLTRLAVQPAPVKKICLSDIGHDGAATNMILKSVFNNTTK